MYRGVYRGTGGTPSSKPNLAYLMYVLSNEYEKSIPHQQQIRPKLHPKSDDNFLFREISGLPPPPLPPEQRILDRPPDRYESLSVSDDQERDRRAGPLKVCIFVIMTRN